MNLRERLRMLRPAAIGRPASSASSAMPESRSPTAPGSTATTPSAATSTVSDAPFSIDFGRNIALRPLETTVGPVLCVENVYPLHHRHGRMTLDAPLLVPDDAWSRLVPVVKRFPMESAAFVDLETTGLSRGTGTYAFLIGVGRFIDGHFRIRQFFLRDFSDERAVLGALSAELESARALVTFNGRAFDWPLLETRATMNRMRLPRLPHLDLLHPARRLWRFLLGSCRLSSLEEHILDFGRTDDVPGADIPQMYFTFLETGDAEPLADVLVHNRLDILSLAALAGYMGTVVAAPLSAAPGGRPLSGEELAAVGKLLLGVESDAGYHEAIACFEKALNRPLPPELRRRTRQLLVTAYRRAGRVDDAVTALHEAAENDGLSPWAYIELAKHYEHRVGDFSAARDWSMRALELALRRRTLLGLRPSTLSTTQDTRRRSDGSSHLFDPGDTPGDQPRPRHRPSAVSDERVSTGSRRHIRDDGDVNAIVHRLRRLERRLRHASEIRPGTAVRDGRFMRDNT